MRLFFIAWILFFLLNIFIVKDIKAQQFAPSIDYKVLDKSNGLPGLRAYDIIQGQSGIIWIGTDNGLCAYDGKNIEVYDSSPESLAQLSNSHVYNIFQDKSGRIWIANELNVDLLDPMTREICHVVFNGQCSNILQDAYGHIWLISEERLFKLDSKRIVSLTFNQTTRKNTTKIFRPVLDSIQFTSIAISTSDGRLWACSNNNQVFQIKEDGQINSTYELSSEVNKLNNVDEGMLVFGPQEVFKYDSESDQFVTLGMQQENINTEFRIQSIIEDHEQNFIVLNRDGHVFEIENMASQSSRLVEKFDMKTPRIRAQKLIEDASQNIWMATNLGVFRWNYKTPICNQIIPFKRKERSNSIRGILELTHGELLFGGYGGLMKANLKDDQISLLSKSSLLPYRFLRTHDQTIYIGSEDDFLWTIDAHTFKLNKMATMPNQSENEKRIISMIEDFDHNLWLGTYQGLIIYNPTSGNSERPTIKTVDLSIRELKIWHLEMASDSSMFIGSNAGLFQLSKSRMEIQKIDADPLLQTDILFIREDQSDLWLGTKGNGLLQYNRDSKRINRYTKSQGLPSNIVYAALPDQQNNLWISTSNGMATLYPATDFVTTYSTADGLPHDEFNTASWYQGSDGTLYFGGLNGIAYFHPSRVSPSTIDVPIYYTKIEKHEGKSNQLENITGLVNTANQIVLYPKDRNFTVQFALAEYTEPDKNVYRYKIEGIDNEWNSIGTQNILRISKPDPGKYVLKIQAASGGKRWSNQMLSLPLNVRYAYHETRWFRISVALGITALLFGIFHFRTRAIRRNHARQKEFSRRLIITREKERHEIASALHNSIAQKLLVHDTSSVLQEIRSLSHSLHPYEVDKFGLSRALELLCQSIQEKSDLFVTHEIHGKSMNLPNHVEVIVYRTIQEGFNNILKHSNATAAKLKSTVRYNKYYIELVDNGDGFNAEKIVNGETSQVYFGITQMQEQIKSIGGNFNIASKYGKGTTLLINIPYVQ